MAANSLISFFTSALIEPLSPVSDIEQLSVNLHAHLIKLSSLYFAQCIISSSLIR
ncbi:hypothetical protein [Lachnoanaerobaculum umeaense]|uniref:hypothetical protein n=1 Tax=Lachnoanaerobaculum umeaense TaxID=617123 RepID=UPI0038CC0372